VISRQGEAGIPDNTGCPAGACDEEQIAAFGPIPHDLHVVDFNRARDLHHHLLKEAIQLHCLGGELPEIDGDADVTAKLLRQFRCSLL
jgi:hypothetical protein